MFVSRLAALNRDLKVFTSTAKIAWSSKFKNTLLLTIYGPSCLLPNINAELIKVFTGKKLSAEQKTTAFLPNLNFGKNEILQAMSNIYNSLNQAQSLYLKGLAIYRDMVISQSNTHSDKMEKLRSLRMVLFEDENRINLTDAKLKVNFIKYAWEKSETGIIKPSVVNQIDKALIGLVDTLTSLEVAGALTMNEDILKVKDSGKLSSVETTENNTFYSKNVGSFDQVA